MSQEVIINIGVSGAGKTTWSEKFIQKNPNYIRINRDDIRKTLRVSLDGYYQQEKNLLNNIENLINNIEDTIYIKALNRGFSVIIDNTNLKISYIQRWVDFVNIYNQSKVKFGDNVTFRLKLFIENDKLYKCIRFFIKRMLTCRRIV